ncbi:ATP-binding protein [Adhaeribacter arboris]|uniref:ATP-binding protein n=1 Tax=Adhaeribacter arboris TaxID=2072846 RepID=UPI0013048B39|nr:ATP-binding protein [Adhaeribacter arboris]
MENEQVQQFIATIENCSKQGTQLIQEFMRQEFLESSQTQVIKRRVELVQVINNFISNAIKVTPAGGKLP